MRIARFCGQIVLIGCVKCGQGGGRGSKNPKILRTSFMYGPSRERTQSAIHESPAFAHITDSGKRSDKRHVDAEGGRAESKRNLEEVLWASYIKFNLNKFSESSSEN